MLLQEVMETVMELSKLQTERDAESTGYAEGIDWLDRYLRKSDLTSDDPTLLAQIGAEWHESLWPADRGRGNRFHLAWRHGFDQGVAVRWQSQVVVLPKGS